MKIVGNSKLMRRSSLSHKRLAACVVFSLAMLPCVTQADTVPTFRHKVSTFPYEFTMSVAGQQGLDAAKPNRITNQSFLQRAWINDHTPNHERITWAEYRKIAAHRGESTPTEAGSQGTSAASGQGTSTGSATSPSGGKATSPSGGKETSPSAVKESSPSAGTAAKPSAAGNKENQNSPIAPDHSSWQGVEVTRPQYADAISTVIKVTPPNPAAPKAIPTVAAPTLPAEFTPAKIKTIDLPEVDVVPIPTKEAQTVTVKEQKAAKAMKSIVVEERNLKPITVETPVVMAPPTIGAVSVNQPTPLPVIDVPSFNLPIIPQMAAVQDVAALAPIEVNIEVPQSSGGGANPQSELAYSWYAKNGSPVYDNDATAAGVIQQGSIKSGSFDVTAKDGDTDVTITKPYTWEFGHFDTGKFNYQNGPVSTVGSGDGNTLGIFNDQTPPPGDYKNTGRSFFYVLMAAPYSEFGKDVVINFDSQDPSNEHRLIDFEMENRIGGTGYTLNDLVTGNFIDQNTATTLGGLEKYSKVGMDDDNASFRDSNEMDPAKFKSLVFANKGTVNLKGQNTTYMFMTVDRNAPSRVQYLSFEGTINAQGAGSVIMKQSPDSSPHSFTNYLIGPTGAWNVSGDKSMGLVITAQSSANKANGAFFNEGNFTVDGKSAVGILYTDTTTLSNKQTTVLKNPMNVTGENAIGFANINGSDFYDSPADQMNKHHILKMVLHGTNEIAVLQAPTEDGGWTFPAAVQVDIDQTSKGSRGIVVKEGQFTTVDVATENPEGKQFFTGDVKNRVTIHGGQNNIGLINYMTPHEDGDPLKHTTLTFDGLLNIEGGTGNIIAYNNATNSNGYGFYNNVLKITTPESISIGGTKSMVAYTTAGAHTLLATNASNADKALLSVNGGEQDTLFYTSDDSSSLQLKGNVKVADVKDSIGTYTQSNGMLNMSGDYTFTNSNTGDGNNIAMYAKGAGTYNYYGNGNFSVLGGTNNRGVVARDGGTVTLNMQGHSLTLGSSDKVLTDSVPLYASGEGLQEADTDKMSSSIELVHPESLQINVSGKKAVAVLADSKGGVILEPSDMADASAENAPYNVTVHDGIGIVSSKGGYVSMPKTHFTFTGDTTGIIASDGSLDGDVFHSYKEAKVDDTDAYRVIGERKSVDGNANASAAAAGAETYYNVNVSNSVIDYKGKGFAMYTKGKGRINAENAKINLYSGVAFGLDFKGLENENNFKPINFTNGKITVMSNDAVIFSFLNLNLGTLNVGNMQSQLLSHSFLDPAGTQVVAGVDPVTNKQVTTFKFLSTEGLTVNFDKDIALTDENIGANMVKQAGESEADYNDRVAAPFFYKRIQLQRSKFDVTHDVGIHVNTPNANEYFSGNVIALSMNSNNQAKTVDEASIHVHSGATVSAGRTDNNGRGGIGVYMDYGTVTLDQGSNIVVEDPTTQSDQAVGVFAFNGSVINAGGKILGYGPQAVGISEQAYKADSNNELILNEFGDGARGQGLINITNTGTIDLKGQGVLGIQSINNVPDSVLRADGEPLVAVDDSERNTGRVQFFRRTTITDPLTTMAITRATVLNKGLISVGESAPPSGGNQGNTSVGIYGTRTGISNDTFTSGAISDVTKAAGIHLAKNSIGIYASDSKVDKLGTVVMKDGGNVGAYVTGDSEIEDQAQMRVAYESAVPADVNNIGIFYHQGRYGSAAQTNASVVDDGTTQLIHHYSDYNKIILDAPEIVGAKNVAVAVAKSNQSAGAQGYGSDPSNLLKSNTGAYNYIGNTITLGKAGEKETLYTGEQVDSGANAIGLLSLKGAGILNLGTVVNNGDSSIAMMMDRSGLQALSAQSRVDAIANLGTINLVGAHSIGLYLNNAFVHNVGTINFDAGANDSSVAGRMAVFAKGQSVVDLGAFSQNPVGTARSQALTFNTNLKNQDQYVYLDNSELRIGAYQNVAMTVGDSPNPAVTGMPIFAYANNNSKVFLNDNGSLTVGNGIGFFFKGEASADNQGDTAGNANGVSAGSGGNANSLNGASAGSAGNIFVDKGSIETKKSAIGAYFTGKNAMVASGVNPTAVDFDPIEYMAPRAVSTPEAIMLADSTVDYDTSVKRAGTFTINDESIGMYLKGAQLQLDPGLELNMILKDKGLGMYVDSASTIQSGESSHPKMTLINESMSNFGVGVYYVGDILAADKDKAAVLHKNPFTFDIPKKIKKEDGAVTINGDLVLNYLAKRAQLENDVSSSFAGTTSSLVYAMVDGGKAATPADPAQLADTEWGSQFTNSAAGKISMDGKLVIGAYVKQGAATNAGTMSITGTDADSASTALLVQNDSTKYSAAATNSGTITTTGNAVGMMSLGAGTMNLLNTGSIVAKSTTASESTAVRLSGANTKFANVQAGESPKYGSLASDFVALYLDKTGAKTVNNGGVLGADGLVTKAGTISATAENGIGVFADDATVDFNMDFKPMAPAATEGGEPTAVSKAIGLYMKGTGNKELFAGHLSVHGNNIGLYAADSHLQFAGPQDIKADGTAARAEGFTPYAVDKTGSLPDGANHSWITATEGATGLFLNQWDAATLPESLVIQGNDNSLGLNLSPKAGGHTDLTASNTFIVNGPTTEAMKSSLTTATPDYPGVGVYVPAGSSLTTAKANFVLNGGIGASGAGNMTFGDTADHGVNVYFGDKGGVLLNVSNADITLGKYVKTFGQGTLVQGDNLNLVLDLPQPSGEALGAHNISINYTDANTAAERHITNKGYLSMSGDGQYGISAVVKDSNAAHVINIFNGLDSAGQPLADSDAHIVTKGGKNQIGIKAQGANVYSKQIAVGTDSMGILMKAATPERAVHLYSQEIGINTGSIGIYNEGAKLASPVHVGTIGVTNKDGNGVLDAVELSPVLSGTTAAPAPVAQSLVGVYMKGKYVDSVTYSDANINFGLASQSRGFSFEGLSSDTAGAAITVSGSSAAPNIITLGESGMGIYADRSKTISVANTNINLLGNNSIGIYALGSLPGAASSSPSPAPSPSPSPAPSPALNGALSLVALPEAAVFSADGITADTASTVVNVDTKTTNIGTVSTINDTLIFAKDNALVNLLGDGSWKLTHDVGLYANKAKITTEAGKVFTFTMEDTKTADLSSTGAVVKDSSVSKDVHIAVKGVNSVGVQASGAVGEVPTVTDLQGDHSLGYIINGLDHRVTVNGQTENMLNLPTANMVLSNGQGQIGIYTLKEGDAGYIAPADKAIIATTGFTIADKSATTEPSLSSIGIYNPGKYEIRNAGDIKVASVPTADAAPSIGIFSSGGDVTSTGDATVGANSVGFYLQNHSISNTGAISAQAGAVGLYAVSDPNSNPNVQGAAPSVSQTGSLTTAGAKSIGLYTKGVATSYKVTKAGDGVTVSAPTSATDTTVYPSFGIYTVDAPSLNIMMKGASGAVAGATPAVDGTFTIGTGATGVYATGVHDVKADIKSVTVGDKGFGFLLKNNVANELNVDAMNLNKESIGVFHIGGELNYSGDINVGSSTIDEDDSANSKYSIGIYTSGSSSDLHYNKGTIVADKPQTFGIFGEAGANIVVGKDAVIKAKNGAYGILGAENTVSITNYGHIVADGEDEQTNTQSTGIVAYSGVVDNQGVIDVTNGAQGIFLGSKATLKNGQMGTINVDATSTALAEPTENKPAQVGSLQVTKDGVVTIGNKVINGGVVRIMNANAVVNLENMKIDAKVVDAAKADTFNKKDTQVGMIVSRGEEEPGNLLGIIDAKAAAQPISDVGVAIGGKLIANKVKGIAEITPAVTQGNNYKKIIIQNVFSPLTVGGLGAFKGSVISESASWIAKVTPVKDGDKSYMNVVMAKVPYPDLMAGTTPGLPEALEDMYSKVANQTPTGQFFDRLDGYKSTEPIAYATAEVRGDLYANMAGQMQTIMDAFNRSYKTHDRHYNFSKETDDWSLIGSTTTHNTDQTAVEGYKAKTNGFLFERESENAKGNKTRTFSLGYGQTDFDYSGSVNLDSSAKVKTFVAGLGVRTRLNESDHGHTDRVWTNRLFLNHHDVTRQQNLPVSADSDVTNHFINRANFQTLAFETNLDFRRYEAWSPNRQGEVYGGLRFNMGQLGDIFESGGALPLAMDGYNYFVAEPHVGLSLAWHRNITPQSRAYLKVATELGARLGSLYDGSRTVRFEGGDKPFAMATPDTSRIYGVMSATLGLNKPNHYGGELTAEYNSKNKATNYYLTLNYKWW